MCKFVNLVVFMHATFNVPYPFWNNFVQSFFQRTLSPTSLVFIDMDMECVKVNFWFNVFCRNIIFQGFLVGER